METRNVTIILEKVREWFYSEDASLKEIALQAFNREHGGVSKFTPSFKISQSPNFHKLGLCYSIIFLYLYGKKFLIWQRYNLFPI